MRCVRKLNVLCQETESSVWGNYMFCVGTLKVLGGLVGKQNANRSSAWPETRKLRAIQ